ncbi:MAG TPA: CARDB domain-containing protein [Longimicrobiales bacterium]|nr:CARDB domain-containing protein [Longimicrobiales bacterium]
MRKLVVLALVALVVSCGDDTTSPDMAPGTPSSLISDATHGEDRNPGFWWLPPMVPQPTLEGTFQSGYSPKVTVVCQEAIGHTDPCDPTKPLVNSTGVQAVFTRGAGLIIEADHFKVEFNTHDFNLRTTSATDTTTYRILVHTDPLTEFGGPFLIGFADFQLGANGGTARNLAVPDSMIALTDNQTLPIRFFLNEFSYEHELREFAQANPGTDATYCLINCSVTVIPGGSTGVEASLFDDVGFELTSVKFGAVNVTRVLVIDERTTEGEGANCAPGRDHEKKNCFRYDVSPTGAFPEPFALGVCPVGITFGAGIWQLVEVRDGVATVHGDTDVSAFLPCTGADGSGSASISLLRPLLDFLVAPLYAEDTKVWGGTADDFSDWFWEVPATLTPSSALTGTAVTGATETLSVLVEATHPVLHGGQPVPLSGADVTFTVTDGSGTVATASAGPAAVVTATTGTDGLATVTLTVGDGTNTIVASSADAEGGPITFARTGALPDLVISSGQPTLTPDRVAPGASTTLSAWTVTNQGPVGIGADISNGFYLSPDATITAADVLLGNNNNTAGVLGAGESFHWGGPTLTIPATTTPGPYHVGILVDRTNAVAESDEGNNFVSAPLAVTDPTLLITCAADLTGGGDLISRGFYASSYPGITLTRVELYMSADAAGTFEFSLTARENAYDGPLLGTARATATLSGSRTENQLVGFDFFAPVTTSGSTVTFAIGQVSGPVTSVFYNVGAFPLGDETAATGCPLTETEGTTPPLDTFRRGGVAANIFGDAPVQ